MLKKSDLRRDMLVFKRGEGDFHTSSPGVPMILKREVGELISFIPNCKEIYDQDLNCDVYAEQLWEVRDNGGDIRKERIVIKLGKWFGVYKRYFNIVNWEKEDEDDLKF